MPQLAKVRSANGSNSTSVNLTEVDGQRGSGTPEMDYGERPALKTRPKLVERLTD